MNLILSRKFLSHLVLLIAITILLSSCVKVNKRVGIDNTPSDYELKLGKARIALPIQTKLLDSVQTLSTSQGYIGAFRTESCGLATFSFATNFCPTRTDWNLGKDAVVKNIYIKLIKSSTSYLDRSQSLIPQTFHLYRMTRIIDTTNKYHNGFDPSKDYIPTPIDSGGTIYTGKDTLTIFLKKSFGREILNASREELDSTYKFIDSYKALLFTCDPPHQGTIGGRLNCFNLRSESMSNFMYLTINFQPTWQSGLPRKDTTLLLMFGIDYAQNFSTYSSKANESEDFKKYIDIEGSAGIKPYLNPILLKESIDKWAANNNYDPAKIIIGKATYYLPFEANNISEINLSYPQYLYPTYRDNSTIPNYPYFTILKDVYSDNNNAGMINKSLKCYYGDFSTTLQKFFKKDKESVARDPELKMWFTPVQVTQSQQSYYSSSTIDYSSDLYSYSIGKINGPEHADYPYVEFIYTVLP